MRDPACDKERCRRRRQIGWTGRDVSDVVARVVESHEDHDDPTEQIDRVGTPSSGVDHSKRLKGRPAPDCHNLVIATTIAFADWATTDYQVLGIRWPSGRSAKPPSRAP